MDLVVCPAVDLELAADRNPCVVYLASLAEGSRPTMRGALRDIARYCGQDDPTRFDWHRLRYGHTQAIRTWLAARFSPATANRYLAALRGVLRCALRLQLLTEAEYTRAILLDAVRGSTTVPGRSLTPGELRALFLSCPLVSEAGPLGARNAAMLSLLYGAGLRRREVVSLDVNDVDVDTGLVTVRKGKGRKARTAYLPTGGRRAVAAWLRIRGLDDGPLLYSTTGGRPDRRHGLRHGKRMGPDAVLQACRGLAKRALVTHFTPHDCRRSFIGDLLDAGMDLPVVSRLAGHAQVTTTARYDRRPERVKARSAELLSIPVGDD